MVDCELLVLSAGYGTRLRPLTFWQPKVLLPVLGKPLIVRILERAQALKPKSIFVNLHYKAEEIKRVVSKHFPEVVFSFEPEILGTGGAIYNLVNSLKTQHLVVYNGDIYADFPLQDLFKFHVENGADITLLVSQKVPLQNLVIEKGMLGRIGENGNTGFTGIAIYKVDTLRKMDINPFDAKEIWMEALKRGRRVLVLDAGDTFWCDIGSPDHYAQLIFYLLKKSGENIFIKTSRNLPPIEFNGFFVLDGDADIEEGTILRSVIVIGEPKLRRGSYKNLIIYPGGEIKFGEVKAFNGQGNCYEIGFGGSDRLFNRVLSGNGSFVRCYFNGDREAFEKHLYASSLLKKCGVEVPEILRVDKENLVIEMEDVGDVSLYTFLKYPPNELFEEELYTKAVSYIAQLHALGSKMEEARFFEKYSFTFEYFLWEQEHFFKNFVERVLRIDVPDDVREEARKIAEKASRFPHVILHRDYQSQNLMVKSKGLLKVIDLVGMRFGPKAYDLVSLLYDPYRSLSDMLRRKLTERYLAIYEELSNSKVEKGVFEEEVLVMRVQRHMQALGAYGYLSRFKNKRFFEKFFVSGLNLLTEDLKEFGSHFRHLQDFLKRLEDLLLDRKCNFDYNLGIGDRYV